MIDTISTVSGRVPCPRCQSAIWVGCITAGGNPARKAHAGRFTAYRAWKKAKDSSPVPPPMSYPTEPICVLGRQYFDEHPDTTYVRVFCRPCDVWHPKERA